MAELVNESRKQDTISFPGRTNAEEEKDVGDGEQEDKSTET